MRRIHFLLCIPLLLALSACIKNDIPYPYLPQLINSIAVRDQVQPADIDDQLYTATLYLDEETDPAHVTFTEFSYTEGARSSLDLLSGDYDLSSPLSLTLSLYQDYDWRIIAVQDIERYFTIEGQVGQTEIDIPGHRVVIKVPMTANLHDLKLLSVKLGAKNVSSMTPDLKPGSIDLSRPLDVRVVTFGRSETWTVYAEKTELLVNTVAVDAWSQVIWAYGEAPAEAHNTFQYRPADSQDWITLPDDMITRQGGNFSARIPHLIPLQSYVVRAVSDQNIGNEITVTMQPTADIPDGDFEQWWLENNKKWNPWDENGERFWDTGNMGASLIGSSPDASNVQPTDHTATGRGRAAKLLTKSVMSKLAAGSVYTGRFVRIDGTNGVLAFGRPWNLRPTKLKGFFQYQTAEINTVSPSASEQLKQLKGRPDSCHIYIALTDWTAPYEIRTNPSSRQLFDPSSPSVIAYGELIFGGTMDAYKEFEIELKYRSTSRVPSYIQITCASSKYGDFFVGGTGAVLYVDQFSLDFDY